jgi:hypothetical protein
MPNNEPPWGPEPVHQAPQPHFPEQERAAEDVDFWDDKEIIKSQTVGGTHYTYAYLRDGSDRAGVWAERESGQVEQVASPYDEHGPSASSVFSALTAPDAPTELGEQMQHEEQLQEAAPWWEDRAVEIDNLLDEYPDQLDMAREDFENGTLDQPGYDARVAELEEFKQRLEDELATYEIEQGEVAAQEPVLEQYAQELAEDGITGTELAEHDWQPGQETPGLGEPGAGPAAAPEAEVSVPEPPLAEAEFEHEDFDDDFDMDM